jgi:hypothetical protein
MHLALLLILHFATLAVQVLAALMGMRRRRLYTIMFAALAVFQLLSLPTLGSLVEEFGLTAVAQAEVLALGGSAVLAVMLYGADRLLPRSRYDPSVSPLAATAEKPARYYVVVGICLVLIAILMFRRGLSILEVTWQESRLDSTYLEGLATLLQFMAFPAIWVTWKAKHHLVSTLIALVAITLFAVYGSRAALLTFPMAVALDLMFRWEKVRHPVLVTLAFGIAALFLHIVGRYLRGFGIAGLVSMATGGTVSLADLGDAITEVDLSGGEAAIWRYFTFAMSSDHYADIMPLTSVVRWLTIYVPSNLAMGVKPEDVTYTLWWHAFSSGIFDRFESFPEVLKVISQGGYGSLHPLLWGELWVNGGLLVAPIFLVILAALILLIESLYALVPSVLYTLSAPATAVGMMMVARGNSVIGLGYTAYILPIASVLLAVTWFASASLFRTAASSLRAGTDGARVGNSRRR